MLRLDDLAAHLESLNLRLDSMTIRHAEQMRNLALLHSDELRELQELVNALQRDLERMRAA
jgi:hypothetical protein